jgi:hypothetical protein
VRFIYHHRVDHRGREGAPECPAPKALGRDVEQPQLPLPQAREARLLLIDRDGAVDEGGGDAERRERIALVLHQRDQWGNHQRRATAQHRGQLVAERLPGPGRHHNQQALAAENARDGFLLAGTKGGEAKPARELGSKVHGADRFGAPMPLRRTGEAPPASPLGGQRALSCQFSACIPGSSSAYRRQDFSGA